MIGRSSIHLLGPIRPKTPTHHRQLEFLTLTTEVSRYSFTTAPPPCCPRNNMDPLTTKVIRNNVPSMQLSPSMLGLPLIYIVHLAPEKIHTFSHPILLTPRINTHLNVIIFVDIPLRWDPCLPLIHEVSRHLRASLN